MTMGERCCRFVGSRVLLQTMLSRQGPRAREASPPRPVCGGIIAQKPLCVYQASERRQIRIRGGPLCLHLASASALSPADTPSSGDDGLHSTAHPCGVQCFPTLPARCEGPSSGDDGLHSTRPGDRLRIVIGGLYLLSQPRWRYCPGFSATGHLQTTTCCARRTSRPLDGRSRGGVGCVNMGLYERVLRHRSTRRFATRRTTVSCCHWPGSTVGRDLARKPSIMHDALIATC